MHKQKNEILPQNDYTNRRDDLIAFSSDGAKVHIIPLSLSLSLWYQDMAQNGRSTDISDTLTHE